MGGGGTGAGQRSALGELGFVGGVLYAGGAGLRAGDGRPRLRPSPGGGERNKVYRKMGLYKYVVVGCVR